MENLQLAAISILTAIAAYFLRDVLERVKSIKTVEIELAKLSDQIASKDPYKSIARELEPIRDALPTLVQGLGEIAILRRDLETAWKSIDGLHEKLDMLNESTRGLNQKIQVLRVKGERYSNWQLSESEQDVLNN